MMETLFVPFQTGAYPLAGAGEWFRLVFVVLLFGDFRFFEKICGTLILNTF